MTGLVQFRSAHSPLSDHLGAGPHGGYQPTERGRNREPARAGATLTVVLDFANFFILGKVK